MKILTNKNTEICTKEAEIAILEQRIGVIETNEDKIEQILISFEKTQDLLREEIQKLNTTFNVLKWSLGISITMFAGIFVFLITELIKIIH